MESNCDNKFKHIEVIARLFRQCCRQAPAMLERIPGAGSGRQYFLLADNEGRKLIATVGESMQENIAFISLSRMFAEKGIDFMPRILATSPDNMIYLQTYAGNRSLYEQLAPSRQHGEYTAADTLLLEEAMVKAARMHCAGADDFDFTKCYPSACFDYRLVRWDMNYFKYCFLRILGEEFNESTLQEDFDRLEQRIMQDSDRWTDFMHRDFQSRNIMLDGNGPDTKMYVIDFQGGRRGPGVYDVASFLWQAKAKYPQPLRNHLIDRYIEERCKIQPTFCADNFRQSLPYFVLLRTLQVLGAYGYRGLIEKKKHFIESLPFGVDNLYQLFYDRDLPDTFRVLEEELPTLAALAEKVAQRHGSRATNADRDAHTFTVDETTPLTVSVTSFSYKKGIPTDPSGNGGGFVFDCRAPHNPGRYAPFKHLTGRDKPVRDFLEADGEILPFIAKCEKIVDASVERYIQRGFTSLSVCFGCTGGQHRSVYSAEALARHISNKYGVKVQLCHREQGISETLPARRCTVVFDSWLRDPQKPLIIPEEGGEKN